MSKEKLRATVSQIYQNMHSRTFVPPVQSLMDIDFYKFLMGQFIHEYYPDVEVTFRLIVRDKNIKIWKYVNIDELREALEFVQTLAFRKTDLYYLRGIDLYEKYMFTEKYLDFLKGLRLTGFKIERSDGTIELTFKARWAEVSAWETIAMAIISELYYRGIEKELSEKDLYDMYVVADNRFQNNLAKVKRHPNVVFADFGQRRRHGFLWQKYVVGEAKRVLGNQFTGTSNTWMAFHHDLSAIGTNAHELPMVVTALADTPEEMRGAQYKVLEQWQEMYGKGLRVILPDTYGSQQFFENAPPFLVDWGAQRQDSGSPIVEIDRYIAWLNKHGVAANERRSIPSDGLSFQKMIDIAEHFKGIHATTFGQGTLFTNDFEGTLPGNDDMRPFSMVIKAAIANGRPCVKLPNDLSKATGPREEIIARYLPVFGAEGRTSREVFV